MSETQLTDAEALALAGTTDDETDFTYHTVELDLGDLSGASTIKLVFHARTAFPATPEGLDRVVLFGPRTKLEVFDGDSAWISECLLACVGDAVGSVDLANDLPELLIGHRHELAFV